MPALAIAGIWLRRAAVSIPWFAYAIAGLVAALAVSHHSARAWHRRYDVAQASIDALAKAQRAANFAAEANKARVDTTQTATTGKDDHASITDLADVRDQYAAYRRLHPATQSVAVACNVPGVPVRAAVVADATRPAANQPPADIVGVAEQGDLYRAQVIGWQRWYADQAAIDRTPVSPPQ